MRYNLLALCVGIAASIAAAQRPFGDSSLSLNAYGSYEIGQVVDGYCRGRNYVTMKVHNVWQQRLFAGLGINAQLGMRTRMTVGLESQTSFSWERDRKIYAGLTPRYSLYPSSAFGAWSAVGDTQSPLLSVSAGLFPYKYNRDVRNLGEYMYRTGIYPPYILNTFDFPYARLLGFRFSGNAFGMVRQDLMLTTETEMSPLQDYSLSYLLYGDHICAVFDIGAGVMQKSLFSVREDFTTPSSGSEGQDNMYPDTIGTRSNPENPADSCVVDSLYYTFRGTKLMGRFAFDPKPLLPRLREKLSREDARLYGEVAALGLKNYPVFYEELWRRIVVMAGFNVPTFKILDILSVEIEYFRSDLANDYRSAFEQGIPQPVKYVNGVQVVKGNLKVDNPGGNDVDYDRDDDLKWSVYLKKNAGGFTLVGLVGNDHTRIQHNDYGKQDYEESLRKPGNWHYMLKVGYGF